VGIVSYAVTINAIDKHYYNELLRIFTRRDTQGSQ
jgi:hypothetical protein